MAIATAAATTDGLSFRREERTVSVLVPVGFSICCIPMRFGAPLPIANSFYLQGLAF